MNCGEFEQMLASQEGFSSLKQVRITAIVMFTTARNILILFLDRFQVQSVHVAKPTGSYYGRRCFIATAFQLCLRVRH
jgi:hypothetical protein